MFFCEFVLFCVGNLQGVLPSTIEKLQHGGLVSIHYFSTRTVFLQRGEVAKTVFNPSCCTYKVQFEISFKWDFRNLILYS